MTPYPKNASTSILARALRTLRRWAVRTLITVGVLALLAFGALLVMAPVWEHEVQAQQAQRKAERREELLTKAIYADYAAPEGTRPECFGRHLFNVGAGFEWGVGRVGFDSLFDRPGISRNLEDPGRLGGMDYHGIGLSIVVPQDKYYIDGPEPGDYFDHALERFRYQQKNAIHDFEREIEIVQSMNETSQYYLDHPEENPSDGPSPERRRQSMKERELEIAEIRRKIERAKVDYYTIDLGIPDSLGYYAHGALLAWLKRDGRIVQFRAGEPKRAQFLDVVRRYRSRKPHEIPTEQGICLPYGFIPDEGTTPADLTMAFRYADAPNVLYTLELHTYQPNPGGPESEASLVTAAARGLSGKVPPSLVGASDVEVIDSFGPRSAPIGRLSGSQGGLAVRFSRPGEAPFENYSVYTGFAGRLQSLALPAIAFEMRSFPKGLAPEELSTQPPPFAGSMARYEQILASLRLRPAEPPLPELAGHVEVAR